MLRYVTYQAQRNDQFNGMWYARPVIEETMTLRDLAQHMADHNSGFSEAQCLGVITAMVACIKEMVLAGKNVKIDDLAIFSCGLHSTPAETDAEFTADNIHRINLRARATGRLATRQIERAAVVKRAQATTKPVRKKQNEGDKGV